MRFEAVQVLYAAETLALGFALVKGDRPARVVAIAGALQILAETLFNLARYGGVGVWGRDVPWQLLGDVLFSLPVLAIAFGRIRYWVLLANSLNLLAIATDAAQLVSPVERWAFAAAYLTWTTLYMLTLTFGTWQAWREKLGSRDVRRARRLAAARS